MQVIRRLTAVLLFALVVLGPLAAQAGAAEALSRSLGELVDAHVIEPPEPPAEGDGLTLAPLPGALLTGGDLAPADDTAVPLHGLPDEPGAVYRPAVHRPGKLIGPFLPPSARQAVLQVFRF